MGRLVKIGSVSGYLGRPSGDGPWPTVIVIHEWYGLTNHIESVVDRLAGLHYLAFAPDLYHGEMAIPGDSDKARTLVQKYGPTAVEDVKAAFDELKTHSDSSGKVASLGFCFGGQMSLALGINRPVDAVCTFYGGGMQQLFGQLGSLKAPVLGLYGDKDQSIPVGTIEEFDKLLDKIGVEHEVIVYPNSGHAFFRDNDPNTYKPEAAKDAWERVQKFLAKNLN